MARANYIRQLLQFTGIGVDEGASPVPDLPTSFKIDGTAVTATAAQINAVAGQAAGTVNRATLAEDALQAYPLRLFDFLPSSGTFTAIVLEGGTGGAATETAAANSSTVTEYAILQFRLPAEYVAGGDIRVTAMAKYTGGTAGANMDIDVICRKVSLTANTTAGSDLCTTAPIAVTSSYAAKTFTIDATGLVAGDVLKITMTQRVHETGGVDSKGYIFNPAVLLDIKG
jgi:hypothetical protein